MNSSPGLKSEDMAQIGQKERWLHSYIQVSLLPLGTELLRFLQKVCLMSQWLTLLLVPPSSVSAFFATVSSEVGRAVWLRFSPPLPSSGPQPSFMAHLSGAVVGISMGLLILRSYEESLQKQCSWWVIVFSFITFLLFAIFWNIFAYELLGVQIPPPPWWRPPQEPP